ncbi:hypothetical protein HZH66_007440 [Vespula vulgaris]|uniref:Uncharacterized protein n=1 Tax=Vespula vulgaris TaxID=7454 RepID=A0A834JXP5_VESVU|nr:hypothetical protein HZH66_007440 [Vespula vulgaris]
MLGGNVLGKWSRILAIEIYISEGAEGSALEHKKIAARLIANGSHLLPPLQRPPPPPPPPPLSPLPPPLPPPLRTTLRFMEHSALVKKDGRDDSGGLVMVVVMVVVVVVSLTADFVDVFRLLPRPFPVRILLSTGHNNQKEEESSESFITGVMVITAKLEAFNAEYTYTRVESNGGQRAKNCEK